tara:strand:+ start:124 stop:429 length:306 start_codon:yes stop_codon:yes gene_type:complete
VLQADGWYGFATTLASTANALEAIRQNLEALARPADRARIQVSVTPSEPVDRDLVRRYEDLGVDRLILVRDFRDTAGGPHPERATAVLSFLADTPTTLGLD